MADPVVIFNEASLRYEAANVLSNITFSLSSGSFTFLTGKSGAGKSSLLRLITAQDLPSAGKVQVIGQDTRRMKAQDKATLRSRLGIVFQDFRLLPHLTAFENAALPLHIVGGYEAQVKKHVRELLSWVGLGNRLDAYPAELSGGEQQRVAIARAIVNKPSMVLADEPTGNVDDDAARRILHLFTELNRMGTAVLFATHQRNLVDNLGFPALLLRNGVMTQ